MKNKETQEDSRECAGMLYDDIRSRIEWHMHENDLSYAEIVGVMELIKVDFIHQMMSVLSFEYEDEGEGEGEDECEDGEFG